MVTTNDKLILWWLTNRKHKNKLLIRTLIYYPDEKSHVPPPPPPLPDDVHTSEDILPKMIKNISLTLNLFWVVGLYICFMYVGGQTSIPWWKKVMYPPPQDDVHTSEDTLTKMIKKMSFDP